MTYKVEHMWHPSYKVTDLVAAESFFDDIFGRDGVPDKSWPMEEPHHLHHFLLPLWGVPIGEMWDLDRLAELCKKNNRSTFFFTSTPSNVQGGVGSHPNALATF